MICTLYSHHVGFDKINEIIQRALPKSKMTISTQDDFNISEFEIKGSIFSASKKIKIAYRQRKDLSYQFPQVDDSPLTANLKGLYGFVNSLPSTNEKVKTLFLQKIQTLNCEFSIHQTSGELKELKPLIQSISNELDSIIFAQPNTVISKAEGQHFLDKNLKLIVDTSGRCEIDDLEVRIDSSYYDKPQVDLTDDQKQRKFNSEEILHQHQVKINRNLPSIESEEQTTIRTPEEIARRVSILAFTNLVAFGNINSEQATGYLKKYGLWDYVTPKERDFLADPTDQKKSHETWKCEDIWVLMWALNKVDQIPFPKTLCSLTDIPMSEYPVGQEINTADFVKNMNSSRSKKEILDAADLYYRYSWACVDARIKGMPIDTINPSVVYERHYALNWLINYMGQDWDDITCDT